MRYIRLQFVWNLILTAYVLIVTGASAAEPEAYRHWLTLPLDYDSQAKRSPYSEEGPLGVAFSPDGKTLAAAFHEMGVVLFDLPTGKVTATFRQPDEKAYGVAFSPDGKLMAVSGLGAWLWDVTKGQPKPLGKHPLWVFSVAFSPDGRTLAVGTSREPFHLWDLATGKSIAEFDIYAGTGPNLDTGLYKPHVSSFAFSPDGKTLAAHIYFYEDELPIFDHMQIWDLELRTLRASFRGTCGLFTSDGESFIYGLNGKIMLRNAKALDEVVTIEGETKIDPTSLSVMALSRDGKTSLPTVKTTLSKSGICLPENQSRFSRDTSEGLDRLPFRLMERGWLPAAMMAPSGCGPWGRVEATILKRGKPTRYLTDTSPVCD